jgi:hypothetical protein
MTRFEEIHPRPEIVELEVGPDGTIRTMYKDGIADMIGAEIKEVKRASRIEFEEVAIDGKIERGWTVRSEHDPELALRLVQYPPPFRASRYGVSRDPKSKLVAFKDREQALNFERLFFWDLLPPKERT